jgi:hypothetical protein
MTAASMSIKDIADAIARINIGDDDIPVGVMMAPDVEDEIRENYMASQTNVLGPLSSFMGLRYEVHHVLARGEWAAYNSCGRLLQYSGRQHVLELLVKARVQR